MNPYAKKFYQTGFSVVPLEYRSKKPLVKWSEFQTKRPDPGVLSRWFSGQVNLGVVTGFNNLTVIDFDTFTEFARWQKWITGLPNYNIISRAFQVRSRRGVHVYFRTIQPERNRHIDKVDIKGKFGLVTGPLSTHESGVIYQPLNAFFIPTIEALSDVLPAQLLLSDQDISPVVSVPDLPKPSVTDPWEAAEIGSAVPGEDLVSKVRGAFRIEQFFKTQLQKSGVHFFVTQCPFHDDQKPSFWIDTEHQVCGCFVCNFPKPLDVINLYGMLYGLSNREAIFALAVRL